MSNSLNPLIGALVMFGAVTAGTYTGRVIPAGSATTQAAVTAPSSTTSADSKPADQSINEQNGQLMPGLTAADYFAAGQACASYRGLDDPKIANSTQTGLSGMQLHTYTHADITTDSLYLAAIKAAGVDPTTCKRVAKN